MASVDGLPCQLDTPTLSPAGLSGHTPGPWRADTNLGCKSIKGRKAGKHKQARWITEIACTTGLSNEAEDLANARLIAAAPELLEAAREGLICAEADIEARRGLNEEHGADDATDPVLAVFIERRNLIAAAIAKATSSPTQVPGDSSRQDHTKAEASQS